MDKPGLPDRATLLRAFLSRDRDWDGLFVAGVRSTGIACRPGCPARSPHPDQLVFFATLDEAVAAGFRPCLRCRPGEAAGQPPADIARLIAAVMAEPGRRWDQADLERFDLRPDRVRRWFRASLGTSFVAWARGRRLGDALETVRQGGRVTDAALDAGFESLSGFAEAVRRVAGRAPSAAACRGVIRLKRILTPLGPVLLGAVEEGLCLLEFAERTRLERQLASLAAGWESTLVPGDHPILIQAERELAEYFRGERKEFDLPLALRGTPFQLRVWEELRRIPYGRTLSYSGLADRLGNPAAVRAVAQANGRNRVAVMVPCHRVIGADGKLTGYAGGIWRKQRLLEVEQASPGPF